MLTTFPREAVEGMVWDYSQVQLGTQSFNGSLQGIGSPGMAGIMYETKGEWEQLEAHVGYTKGVSKQRACKFVVIADQVTVYTSPEIHGGEEPQLIKVPITGARQVMVQIQPVTYGGTLGAAFGQPMLKKNLTAEEKNSPFVVELNGRRIPYNQLTAPTELPINIPIKPGETTYQVQVINDPATHRIQVKVTP